MPYENEENELDAIMKRPFFSNTEGEDERERLQILKEECMNWWHSPGGKECIRNAKTPNQRFD